MHIAVLQEWRRWWFVGHRLQQKMGNLGLSRSLEATCTAVVAVCHHPGASVKGGDAMGLP